MNKNIEMLLVEDNDADVLLIKESFAQLPYQPVMHWLTDGESAISFLNKEGKYSDATIPDIIMLDINLPKYSGLEILTFIRNNPLLKHIPVVMLSTSQTDRDIKNCYAHGANAYMVKPMDLEEFMENIRVFMLFWLKTALLPNKY